MLEASDRPGELVVRIPSFWQCMKLGAGFALGAGVISIFGFMLYAAVIVGAIGAIGAALSPRHAPPQTAMAPAVSRSAPPTTSEFEQRVQRIQHDRADLTEEGRAFGEALRREKSSRSTLAK